MTTAEIKHYISAHRNDEQEFRSALKVLMTRSTDAPKQPYPFDLANPEVECLLIFVKIVMNIISVKARQPQLWIVRRARSIAMPKSKFSALLPNFWNTRSLA
jgi:hypothetical protein